MAFQVLYGRLFFSYFGEHNRGILRANVIISIKCCKKADNLIMLFHICEALHNYHIIMLCHVTDY